MNQFKNKKGKIENTLLMKALRRLRYVKANISGVFITENCSLEPSVCFYGKKYEGWLFNTI